MVLVIVIVCGMTIDIPPQHTDKITVCTTVVGGEMMMGLVVHSEDQYFDPDTINPTLEILSCRHDQSNRDKSIRE